MHQHAPEQALADRGLANYWGYNSLGFLAPDVRYATSAATAVREFKTMVRRLHAAGLEVILDVVYNHTAEGDRHGPTLSWRGIDNAAYYRLRPDDSGAYLDVTGCGNTLDTRHPRVAQLVTDSLRYWVRDMHVDGFRFDLASALARGRSPADMVDMGGFIDTIRRDPVLSRVKLIAEPWDLGRGGYQLGRFPAPFREWNDKFRKTVRRFWRGDSGQVADLATRLAGSSDLYAGGRGSTASVNFVAAHDGFTLTDLVSYRQKRNADNGEGNRDGADDGCSWNCGVEGPSDSPKVAAGRARARRSLVATLALAQGVPMLCAGDEMGRTQSGNNNAYCQDNETSWVDWRQPPDARRFLAFVRELVAFRARHPVLRRRFLRGHGIGADRVKDLAWFDPAGGQMTDVSWRADERRCVGMRLDGAAPGDAGDPPDNDELDTYRDLDAPEQAAVDDTLLLLFNAGRDPVDFRLPEPTGGAWQLVFDTAEEAVARRTVDPACYRIQDRSVVVLVAPRDRSDRGEAGEV